MLVSNKHDIFPSWNISSPDTLKPKKYTIDISKPEALGFSKYLLIVCNINEIVLNKCISKSRTV